MRLLLLILIIIIEKYLCQEDSTCYKSLNIKEISDKFGCDEFLISSIQNAVNRAKKLNKYLEQKVASFTDYKNRSCVLPKVSDVCAQKQVFTSCIEAVAKHGSGVFLIDQPYTDLKPLMIYCETDPNGGAPWTIIQRQTSDNIFFNHDYHIYVNGFGGLYDSFWMGLERIHQLTTNQNFELWIQLTKMNRKVINEKYSHFGVGSAAQNYNLLFLGTHDTETGFDGLRASAGYAFATTGATQSTDFKQSNCTTIDGGWWYGNGSCERHLNSALKNVIWSENYKGFKKVQMAIREIKFNRCY